MKHQYIDRLTGKIETEEIMADAALRALYDNPFCRNALGRLLSGRLSTNLGAWFTFDVPIASHQIKSFIEKLHVDLSELSDPPSSFITKRDVFVRKIRYETCRRMPNLQAIVSPADGKVVIGSLDDEALVVKNRFFSLTELMGDAKKASVFQGGDFAVFRLAPPDYHYFHFPVSGRVTDFYELEGKYFSVNPYAVRSIHQVLSSNVRHVTLIDTDIEGGTAVGIVAVIEVGAQVIGKIVSAASEIGYEKPCPVIPGMFVHKGMPKGYFEPGSSTVVILMQQERAEFLPDLLQFQSRTDTSTIYSATAFGKSMTEVRVQVRDTIAFPKGAMPQNNIPLINEHFLVNMDGYWVTKKEN